MKTGVMVLPGKILVHFCLVLQVSRIPIYLVLSAQVFENSNAGAKGTILKVQ